jgi:beta-galactosidase
MGLWELMGCRETAVQVGPRGRTTLRWTGTEIPGLSAGDSLPARWYEETLEPLTKDAHAVAQFENGAPAAVLSRFGKGKTLMLGSYLSAAYETAPSPALERFYAGLLEWAGVTPLVESAGPNIEVRTLDAGVETLVFVFNHARQPTDTAVRLRAAAGNYTALDLISGAPAAVKHSGATLELDKRLGSTDVWVVKLTHR